LHLCAPPAVSTSLVRPCVCVRTHASITGEHIDYMGYGVMPMAVALSVRCVVQTVPGGDRLQLHNVNSDKYRCACVLSVHACTDHMSNPSTLRLRHAQPARRLAGTIILCAAIAVHSNGVHWSVIWHMVCGCSSTVMCRQMPGCQARVHSCAPLSSQHCLLHNLVLCHFKTMPNG
jgi:hypothetical protein